MNPQTRKKELERQRKSESGLSPNEEEKDCLQEA